MVGDIKNSWSNHIDSTFFESPIIIALIWSGLQWMTVSRSYWPMHLLRAVPACITSDDSITRCDPTFTLYLGTSVSHISRTLFGTSCRRLKCSHTRCTNITMRTMVYVRMQISAPYFEDCFETTRRVPQYGLARRFSLHPSFTIMIFDSWQGWTPVLGVKIGRCTMI